MNLHFAHRWTIGVAVLVICCQLVAAADEPSRTLIVPGVSVGLVKLGDTKETLASVMGKWDLEGFTDTTPKAYTYQYYKQQLTYVVRDDKVFGIFVLNDHYRTKEGVGVKSSMSEVESALGTNYSKTEGKVGPELTYPSGIRLLFDGSGQVLGVEVRLPGH